MGRRRYNGLFNQIMQKLLEYEGHVYMVTLTMKTDEKLRRNTISDFIKKLEYRGIRVDGYLWVKELQKRGVVHFHIIILVPEKMRGFYSLVSESWKHGFVFTKGVEKSKLKGAIMYIMKYIRKDLDKEQVNEKMKRRIGRGGILRFRIVPFMQRLADFSDFQYVGTLAFPGLRVKFYRNGRYLMIVAAGRRGIGVDIVEINIEEKMEQMKYKLRSIGGVSGKVNSFDFQVMRLEELREVYMYHKFSLELDYVIFS